MKRSYLFSSLFVLIAAGGIGTYFYGDTIQSIHPSSNVSAVVPQNQQAVYRLNFTLNQIPHNANPVTPYRLNGKFVVYADSTGDLISEWGDLTEFAVLGVPAQEDVVTAMIGEPQVTRRAKNGELEHFIGGKFPGRYLGVQLNILDKAFINHPEFRSEPLTRRERDEFGQFNVQYTYKKASDGQSYTVLRRWLQSTDSKSIIDAGANSFEYTYNNDGQLQKVNGTLTINFKVSGGAVDVYTTEFAMELDSHEPTQEQKVTRSTRDLPRADLSRAEIASRTALATADDDQITMPSIENIDQALTRVDAYKTDSPGSEQQEIFQTIKFGVMANPGEANKIVEKILSIKGEDEDSEAKSSLLFGALTATNLPEVADSFADLAQSECPNKICKVQAITSLNIHDNPSAANGKTLIQIAHSGQDEDIVSSAYLAAGSVASKTSGDIPEVTQSLLADIKTATEDRRVTVIQAMGNHGNADYYPVLEAEAKSEDTFERSSALYSLRNISVDGATQALIASLNIDDSDIVNVNSLRALAQKPLSAPEQFKVAEAVVGSTDKDVQAAATDLLLNNLRANADGSSEAIAAYKEKASDPDLKAYLDEAMDDIKRDKEKDSNYR
ncbi:MAG: hypothetical protein V4655_08490 [Bdellovibrionota bacterium]